MRRPLLVLAAVLVGVAAIAPAAGAPAQTPKRGGTLVLGGYLEPACLGLDGACDLGPLLATVLDAAFELEDNRWVPTLVERVTPTEDPRTFVYDIRPDARWSDGKPVTSADFVFTHRVWVREGLAPVGETPWARIRSLGKKRFRATLVERSTFWRIFPLFVAPRHVLRGQDLRTVWRDGVVDPKTGRPIASGPFLTGRWERGKQITLVRNPNYWGSRASYLDRVVVRFVRGPEMVDALLRGEIDVAPAPLTADDVARLGDAPGITLRVYGGIALERLVIRVGSGGHHALRSKPVRRALAYGIDREAIVRELFGEVAPRLKPHDSLLFLSQDSGYRPNWSRYRYRPATARRLLEQAGCRRGTDGIYECGGERLRLVFATTAGNLRRQRTLELVQRQLFAVGVEVVPRYHVGLGFLDAAQFDVALFALGRDWPEDLPHAAYRCQGEVNYSGYCDRLVTRDLAQLGAIIDLEQLARVGNAADRKLARDVPAIPLFQSPSFDAMRSTVRGAAPSPYAFYLNLEDWWLER